MSFTDLHLLSQVLLFAFLVIALIVLYRLRIDQISKSLKATFDEALKVKCAETFQRYERLVWSTDRARIIAEKALPSESPTDGTRQVLRAVCDTLSSSLIK